KARRTGSPTASGSDDCYPPVPPNLPSAGRVRKRAACARARAAAGCGEHPQSPVIRPPGGVPMILRLTRSSLLLALGAAAPAFAQQPQRTPVPASAYGKWETLGAGALSPDGKWIAYPIRRVEGTAEVRYRALGTDSTRVAPGGEEPVFSRNG